MNSKEYRQDKEPPTFDRVDKTIQRPTLDAPSVYRPTYSKI